MSSCNTSNYLLLSAGILLLLSLVCGQLHRCVPKCECCLWGFTVALGVSSAACWVSAEAGNLQNKTCTD